MRVVEGIRKLNRAPHRFGGWQRTSQQPLGKRLSFEILHHEKPDRLCARCRRLWVLNFANVMDVADVRMIERCDGASLAFESLTPPGVGRELRGEDLYGNRAIETRISRFVHLPHAARAKGTKQLIRAEPRIGTQLHSASRKGRRPVQH
jgi:hypothetical protein